MSAAPKAPCPLAVMDEAGATLDMYAGGVLSRPVKSPSAASLREARAKVAELVDAQRRSNRNARLMHDDRQQEMVCIPPADWAAIRAALAAFSEVRS